MNTSINKILLSLALLLSGSGLACAQRGIPSGFVYDQQSSTNDALGNSIRPVAFGGGQFIGESFVPTLSAIDFVRFRFGVVPPNFSTATGVVSVNLWSGGISNGVLLAATAPVFISLSPIGGTGATNFFFDSTVTLTPGATYYLQPFVQSPSGNFGVELFSSLYSFPPGFPYTDPYPAGSAVPNGNIVDQDLWFREGIVAVPEPASGRLLFLASVFGFCLRLGKNTCVVK